MGDEVWAALGLDEGAGDIDEAGEREGVEDGNTEGLLPLGAAVGVMLGAAVGVTVGNEEGTGVGPAVGALVGLLVHITDAPKLAVDTLLKHDG